MNSVLKYYHNQSLSLILLFIQKISPYISDWPKAHAEFIIKSYCPGGGHLGIFWVDMCRPGLQIGTRF